MECFAKIVHGFKSLTISAESSVLDVSLVAALCCYAVVMHFVFGALFCFQFSVSRILSWDKYLYRQLK